MAKRNLNPSKRQHQQHAPSARERQVSSAPDISQEGAALAGISEILGLLIMYGGNDDHANALGVLQDRVDLANERLSRIAG